MSKTVVAWRLCFAGEPEATSWRFTPQADGRIRIERFQIDAPTLVRSEPILQARETARQLAKKLGRNAEWQRERVTL